MRITNFLIIATVVPGLCWAQKKELAELQREMGLVQDKVGVMQRSLEEKMNALQTLLQQTLESSNKANASIAGLEVRLREQEKNVAAPVLGIGTKVDQMSQEFAQVKESVADMNARLGKLQSQIVDVGNAVKTLSAPPPPPPGATSAVPGAPTGPPPGMSAQQLYDSAARDKLAGNQELALQGFQDFVKWYPDTELAPDAQFSVGDILFAKRDYEGALAAFDGVLERYPDNTKTPDAMYMKARSLFELNQRDAAVQEFRSIILKFPSSSNVVTKARGQLKSMGINPPAAPKSKGKKSSR